MRVTLIDNSLMQWLFKTLILNSEIVTWFVQLPPEPLILHFDGDGDDDL